MAHHANTIRLLMLIGAVFSLCPALAMGNDASDINSLFSFTRGSESSSLQIRDRSHNHVDANSKRQKIRRNDLSRALLNVIFPEKVFRIKRLDGGHRNSLAKHRLPLQTQYMLGLTYQGARLKIRTYDDRLGLSAGGNPGSTSEAGIGLALKLRW